MAIRIGQSGAIRIKGPSSDTILVLESWRRAKPMTMRAIALSLQLRWSVNFDGNADGNEAEKPRFQPLIHEVMYFGTAL